MESHDSRRPEEPEVGPGTARVMGGIFIVAAAALAWTGLSLRPGDEAATEGVQRLLFEVIPMVPFAFVGSVVFLAMGLWVIYASFNRTS